MLFQKCVAKLSSISKNLLQSQNKTIICHKCSQLPQADWKIRLSDL